MNDWHSPKPAFQNNLRRSFERLLRKLLNYPNFPAVVLVHAYIWYQVGVQQAVTVWGHIHALCNQVGSRQGRSG